jgi:hypothetical protein
LISPTSKKILVQSYRNAIEEELEVLYDAYYEELEQYANHQQRYVNSGGTIPPPPGPGPFPGSVELDKNGSVVSPMPTTTTTTTTGTMVGSNKRRGGGKQRHQQPPSINGRKALPSIAQQHHDPLHHLHHHHHHKESEFDDEDVDEYEDEEEEYEDEEEEEDEEDDEEEEEDDEDDRRLVNGRGKAARQTPAGRRSAVGKGGRRVNGTKRDGGFNLSNLAVSGEYSPPSRSLVRSCACAFIYCIQRSH